MLYSYHHHYSLPKIISYIFLSHGYSLPGTVQDVLCTLSLHPHGENAPCFADLETAAPKASNDLLRIPPPGSAEPEPKSGVFHWEQERSWDCKGLSSTEICPHNEMRFHPRLVITASYCCFYAPSQMTFLCCLCPWYSPSQGSY